MKNKKLFIAMIILFIIFLIRAFYLDYKMFKKMEMDYNEFQQNKKIKSKVKVMLSSTRDSVLRGLVIGVLSGGLDTAVESAVTWCVTNGVIGGIADCMNWNVKLAQTQ